MYIALEGHDGSGKTTTGQMLVERLNDLGKDAIFVRAPGMTSFGSYIRATWHPDERVRYLQLLANHVEIIESVVKPALEQGKIVVQDRTYLSSLVYSRDYVSYYSMLYNAHEFITRNPDVWLFFHCPPEEAVERLSSLEKDLPDPDSNNIYKLQMAYKIEALALGGFLIDTGVSQEEVVDKCLTILLS